MLEHAVGRIHFRRISANKKDLKDGLARYRQIKLSLIGRRTGRTISVPVWFVLEGDWLYRCQYGVPTRIPISSRETVTWAFVGPGAAFIAFR